MIRTICIALAATVATMCAIAGPPRLIGYGCTDAPLGLPQLAREESDYNAPCRSIEPLPWIWVVW